MILLYGDWSDPFCPRMTWATRTGEENRSQTRHVKTFWTFGHERLRSLWTFSEVMRSAFYRGDLLVVYVGGLVDKQYSAGHVCWHGRRSKTRQVRTQAISQRLDNTNTPTWFTIIDKPLIRPWPTRGWWNRSCYQRQYCQTIHSAGGWGYSGRTQFIMSPCSLFRETHSLSVISLQQITVYSKVITSPIIIWRFCGCVGWGGVYVWGVRRTLIKSAHLYNIIIPWALLIER